jgi:hypothetical protein
LVEKYIDHAGYGNREMMENYFKNYMKKAWQIAKPMI